MRIERFEDIECWKEARKLSAALYKVTRKGEFRQDFALRDQICRSAISMMANIAEGFGRGGKTEFVRFLTIARGSAMELESHLYLASDLGYLARSEFESLYDQTETTKRLIGGFIHYLTNHHPPNRPIKQPNNRPTDQPDNRTTD